MNNIGSKWLRKANLQQSDYAAKICALAALEMGLQLPLGVDAVPLIWEGNIPGTAESVQRIRRCLIYASSVAGLLRAAGIQESTLSDFVREVRSV